MWHGINGASIPRILWPIPFIGHPFEGDNKFWSPPHDMGYDGSAIVIDITTTEGRSRTPEQWAAMWNYIPGRMMIDPRSLGRGWWDGVLLEGMQICGESKFKQSVVYRGVRLGAGLAWRRCGRDLKRHTPPKVNYDPSLRNESANHCGRNETTRIDLIGKTKHEGRSGT
jgi:hypothetical protein